MRISSGSNSLKSRISTGLTDVINSKPFQFIESISNSPLLDVFESSVPNEYKPMYKLGRKGLALGIKGTKYADRYLKNH
jgi:hypothetical protein